MDEINRAILREVQRDPRISYSSLGAAVGLSANAAGERLRRLTARGVVRLKVLVDPAATGQEVLQVLIDLRLRPEQDNARFEATVASFADIVEVHHVTGEFDYVVRAEPPDVAALDRLLRDLKERAGVAATSTRLILRPMSVVPGQRGRGSDRADTRRRTGS
ncbi:Lrp/AsnC family leucine-responsive transcriptional regulator [Actinoalloteichus hoggarensis]|uniref:Leucine-responsive regulatory protein n=1 Tax=Actinoalloteichus hoggarensis TaxID=1470176 RepID=A0A221W1B5_9PSEU|nr:Lrp/AsnC family transcriptional regulator [Actinoalloteichus hoggarensis]ASO19577.1 Leucine-responsive regulatory protein [Actinoalloteichus hoggarensis]MBB5919716.1 Lrp/AsnC family leucine-responsive transcriptional regulator [Actinoalloteichus hoggarensis]